MPSRIPSFAASAGVALATALALVPLACSKKEPPKTTYFERSIAPLLTSTCVRTNTGAGCHVSTEKGNAFGNLDVSSYAQLAKRRDLLLDYGPYGQPAFLVKAIDNGQIGIESFDGTRVTVKTDIKHTGGPILDPTGSAYQTLRRWIDNGATENNAGEVKAVVARQPCTNVVPTEAGFDRGADPARADFQAFKGQVVPVMKESCAASNCHGIQSNELYLTCGDSPEEVRWNYFAATQYLAKTPEQSELLRRPLAPAQGGSFHEGGVIFESRDAGGYRAFLDWAAAHGPPELGALEKPFLFFAEKVQPVLAKKGCMMVQCHSAAQFHDYRLRGGSAGAFSLSATRRNHALSLRQVSLESPDPDASRMVRKNLFRPELMDGAQGITHRGGPLFEDFPGKPASAAQCDAAKYDYDAGNLDEIPAYCVIREWIARERAALTLEPLSAIVYVRRPAGDKSGRAQDFDVYSPGADLRVAQATLAADGAVTIGSDTSLTAGCGLAAATADIRRPAVSWDGKTVAFAARASQAEPLAVYTMAPNGAGCAKHVEINTGEASKNGLLVHNFDPAFAPPDEDGTGRIVFASTRGNLDGAAYDYSGPQRTPADPSKPNANLYVHEAPGGATVGGKIRQLTYLLNVERQPSFMLDGRIIMTAEKRAPGFYQLAGRRINVDGGDYHPLYGQRSSVSHAQVTELVELSDRNFAAIFSDPGAPAGAGALGIINRSIGVDFQSSDPKAYVIDASVIDPAAPASPEPSFFLRSLKFPDPSATGKLTGAVTGAYRSPSILPSPKLLVSYGAATTLAGFGGDYDVYLYDPTTGAKTKLLGEAGSAEVEAVAVYGRAGHGVFRSALDEPNGHTTVQPGKPEADVTILDTPVLASLLFQNTPTGRPLEKGITGFSVYEDLPPPLDLASLAAGGANVATDDHGQVYVRRRLLGQVSVREDGSAHVRLPGGVPVVLRLPDGEGAGTAPRYQRESMVFAPGEYAHQSFRQEFFDGLCGNCHGSLSGRPTDVAVRPDILTQASAVSARGSSPDDLNKAPGARGAVEGPPARP